MFLTTSCSYKNSNKVVSEAIVNKKEIGIQENDKKYINFIPELAMGNQSKFEPQKFKALNTQQNTLHLEKGDSNTCAFAFHRERYAYIGCNTSPARIVKYDMQLYLE